MRVAQKAMRKRVTAKKLHDLLEAEFRSTAADHCLGCRVPMPSYFAGAREGPNWRVGSLEECGGLCHTILQELAARMGERYELMPPSREGPAS